jgi:hypothetical protein
LKHTGNLLKTPPRGAERRMGEQMQQNPQAVSSPADGNFIDGGPRCPSCKCQIAVVMAGHRKVEI